MTNVHFTAIMLAFAFAFPACSLAQSPPEIEWQRCLGGSAEEFFGTLRTYPNGDCLLDGSVYSMDGDISGAHGGIDAWVVKLDNQGVILWQRALGGSAEDHLWGNPTGDGGAIMVGQTSSSDGDVVGYHGGMDGWVVKLDSLGGIEWQRTIGGSGFDRLVGHYFQETSDGGYLLVGNTTSSDGDVALNRGGSDLWVIKLSDAGLLEWEHTYGGSSDDFPNANGNVIIPAQDEGFVIMGQTRSSDHDVTDYHGGADLWVIKVDGDGDLLWQHALGGSGEENTRSIIATMDGGSVVVSNTDSDDGDVAGFHGLRDCWVVKLDAFGILQWQRTLGGSGDEFAYSVAEAPNGDLLLIASTGSEDGDVSGQHNPASNDVWVVRLTDTGDLLWQHPLGGSSPDSPTDMVFTTTGGCMVAGTTLSTNGDVVGNHGQYDAWLLELDASGTLLWQLPMGGTSYDQFEALRIVSDGGYLATGEAASNDGDVIGHHGGSNYDLWLVKMKPTTTNIAEGVLSQETLHVYPDPSLGPVTIQFPGNGVGVLSVIDLLGKVVRKEQTRSAQHSLDLSTYAKGIYELQWVSDHEHRRARVMLE